MKTIYILIILGITTVCRAQSLILPILESASNIVQGAYYKDLDNELGKFVGTWKYTIGTTSFTITLQKKAMFYNTYDNYYEDIIIGEYKYISNGVTIVNTLPNLGTNYDSQYKYNISGLIIKDQYSQPVGNRRIQLGFVDPERDYLNMGIFIKYIAAVGNTPAKIEIEFTGSMSIVPSDTAPTSLRVPEQNYVLLKQ
ncbi:DUF6705 family protein [Flavobacterium subsaxonicum]|uniref:DUF6705 domain-containing protein n=1 Tax=Flavobacterium subsaxonicum WB 4.1-42 = DSM 21790 TaxID=1121898 RepID=A0A0A2MPY0_9FLAO|nr:DUF6705 family protein [Flavobacterium subsaxonicum]KGO94394.1 hypothetical protein Q766_05620 [Flavobacterium subsaxonicum WB 4.1-42 = DSM 21790]